MCKTQKEEKKSPLQDYIPYYMEFFSAVSSRLKA